MWTRMLIKTSAMPPLPPELRDAIMNGTPTREQARWLMELEAAACGMTFDEALQAAREGRMYHSPVEIDFRYWVVTLGLNQDV